MIEYLNALRLVRDTGDRRACRTGDEVMSIFSVNMKFDLSKSFPAVTTKKLYFRSVVHELIWFLRGESSIQYLKDNNVKIWDAWAGEDGHIGPGYGVQWRSWGTGVRGVYIDQIQNAIDTIKSDPTSRRIIVTAWRPDEIHMMALPPCHMTFQFHVSQGRLNCHLLQRSGDMFLGVPFNIASYALLTCMVAQVTGLSPGILSHTIVDAHIYENHIDQVNMQLGREPLALPSLALDRSITCIDDFESRHVSLDDYEHHPAIKAPVAV